METEVYGNRKDGSKLESCLQWKLKKKITPQVVTPQVERKKMNEC